MDDNQKTGKIENFIGIYDNYIMPEECKKAIKLFKEQSKFKNTFNRMQSENTLPSHKKDEQYFADAKSIDIWWEDLKTLIVNFDIALKNYLTSTGASNIYSTSLNYTTLKIQKTLPTEGYHVWHIEHSGTDANRAFVFSIYLNNVDEGGETEFLNFSKRVKPKTGRIVIWPAGFPYLHRGNPPLSGEKYILTSWLVL